MDLEAALLAEHSKKQCLKIVRYINGDKIRFKKLVTLFLTGEYRVVQRAAWPVSYCIEDHPELLKPYWAPFMKALEDPKSHPAVHRNILRLLQFVPEVPRKHQGLLMNACFKRIEDPKAKAAEKAFALTVLEQLSETYPDIRAELLLIIDERWDQETPAFRSRGAKIRKRFRNF